MKTNHRLLSGPAYATVPLPFDAHDTRDLPPFNLLREAWDKPLRREDLGMDQDMRLLSVAQCVRNYVEGKRHE